MAARCSFCGEELRPNSMFCLSCGQLAAASSPATPLPIASGGTAPASSPAPLPPPPAPGATVPGSAVVGAASPLPSGPVQALPPTPPPAPPGSPGIPLGGPAYSSAPPPAAAQAAHAGQGYVLRFSTGTAVVVTGPTLIGRSPDEAALARRIASVAIDDPERSLSRVHALVRPEARGLWLIDEGSGNGTVLIRQGRELPCPAGQQVAVFPGDLIRLGSVSCRVSPAS